MPRHRSRTSPVSTASMKRPSPPGLLQMTEYELMKLERKAALHDLVGLIVVGPPDMFPIKPATAQALFGLAVDRLAKRDKTTADALRRYAAQCARLERLDWRTSTNGLPPGSVGAATLNWLSESLKYSAEDLQNAFHAFSRAVGKQKCHRRTLRRQHKLMCDYGRTNNYPRGSRGTTDQRKVWVRLHLQAMIAKAQEVPCWHPQNDLSDQDRDKILDGLDDQTPLARLSVLVLAQLHSTTVTHLLRHLLSRRRG